MITFRHYVRSRWKTEKWHQQALDQLLAFLATGARPDPDAVRRIVPPSRRRETPAAGPGAGQNLSTTGRVLAALAGLVSPGSVRDWFRSQRLRESGIGISPFEGGSEGYFSNLQLLPAVASLAGLPREVMDDEDRRFLRRRLALFLVMTTPSGDVISPGGRDYSADPSEELGEVTRAILGLPPRRGEGDKWWGGWHAYGPRAVRVEGEALRSALFTTREIEAFHVWRRQRVVRQELAALLSELYTGSGAEGTLSAYAEGAYTAWVRGLESYVSGDNGMTVAVSVGPDSRYSVVWSDHHADAVLEGGEVVARLRSDPRQEVGRLLLNRSRVLATLRLDGQGVEIDGVRVDPVRTLPPGLPASWTPRHAGFAADEDSDAPPPPEEPEEPEDEGRVEWPILPKDLSVGDVLRKPGEALLMIEAGYALLAQHRTGKKAGQLNLTRLERAARRHQKALGEPEEAP